jgi:hypothetical protein
MELILFNNMLMKNKCKTGFFNKSLIYIFGCRIYTRIIEQFKSALISFHDVRLHLKEVSYFKTFGFLFINLGGNRIQWLTFVLVREVLWVH